VPKAESPPGAGKLFSHWAFEQFVSLFFRIGLVFSVD